MPERTNERTSKPAKKGRTIKSQKKKESKNHQAKKHTHTHTHTHKQRNVHVDAHTHTRTHKKHTQKAQNRFGCVFHWVCPHPFLFLPLSLPPPFIDYPNDGSLCSATPAPSTLPALSATAATAATAESVRPPKEAPQRTVHVKANFATAIPTARTRQRCADSPNQNVATNESSTGYNRETSHASFKIGVDPRGEQQWTEQTPKQTKKDCPLWYDRCSQVPHHSW